MSSLVWLFLYPVFVFWYGLVRGLEGACEGGDAWRRGWRVLRLKGHV